LIRCKANSRRRLTTLITSLVADRSPQSDHSDHLSFAGRLLLAGWISAPGRSAYGT